ncbi:protein-tyrosine phosphatase [Alkalibacterium putridalgicola]|uniref:Tyrosine-protein phosphatase n=1 Tax=Alkalibacterium putridalgicola TaxID=426703 RepID=A0A1H7QN36_9LACT|nr:CpsB/CapC family capsule biosynthesis tyrosine phosphatase [Alkalibacterium putridalgicola]GEK88397.1 tyrosine protein phosphatase [Alkalibacterium putridalgicola]SEL49470.1 protein-tyrosine phosphatase [Alkalibacterium putridalgicola]
MFDLHCHILPGIDDGAKTTDDSIAMAEAAVEEGITHILATPHHMNRSWMNDKQKVMPLVKELQAELDRRHIDLTIFPGQEVRLYGEILKDMEDNKILFVDEQKQYVLIEFPTETVPTYAERLFYDLQNQGKTPIIVHPERNHELVEHPNRLKNLVDKGALAQLTAASYTGGFGKKIEKLSKQLIEANLVHFIASDAHNTTNRTFHMKEAYDLLAKDYGRSKRHEFHQATKDLLNGDQVIPADTSSIKKSFLSKWFN